MRWACLLLVACGAPAPASGPPPLRHLEEICAAMGLNPVVSGDRLTLQHAPDARAGGHPYEVEVSVVADPPVARLRTRGLFRLADATSDGGVVRLLTLVATVDAELTAAAVSLDGASGEVIVTVDLPADDGVGDLTFQQGVGRVLRTADALGVRLREAASPTP